MTKRAKIIIGSVIAVLLALAGVAGYFSSNGFSSFNGTNSNKSSNQIKADVEKAFEGKDYFQEVKVKTYSGNTEETDLDKAAASAAIQISFNKMDAVTFKEAASLLPELKMTAFYSIGDTDEITNITSATGFKYSDFKNVEKVDAIAASLKVRETFKGQFWQISAGNAEGTDSNKLKTQFVTAETNAAEIRKTIDAVLTAQMDVLPVTKTELSQGSFSQFAAVDGKMENYDKGLEIGLKFADAAFLDSQQVVLLGLGDDIQITYTALRADLSKEKVTEIAKELNKEQLFKINVVSPEDAKAKLNTPTEAAQPSESASPSTEASPTPSESGK